LSEVKNIAGMSMKGGKKDNFFFCLIEYYPKKERWFLRSLLQVKDEQTTDGDVAIRGWISKFHLSDLVVDFPLSTPFCQNCNLDCPGANICPVDGVKVVRESMEELISQDELIRERDPKKYEKERLKDIEFNPKRKIIHEVNDEHLLSRAFKRKLKKGFLPYWNRGVDFWVWRNYYDHLLKYFNLSYDSFGTTSLMILSRFSYLKRHFPKTLQLCEGNVYLTLIELMKTGIIKVQDVVDLNDFELHVQAKLNILKDIEKSLDIFIYDHDLEILIKNPRAYDSFILALVGQRIQMNKVKEVPDWAYIKEGPFIVPDFG
jgi:hypothetical protein